MRAPSARLLIVTGVLAASTLTFLVAPTGAMAEPTNATFTLTGGDLTTTSAADAALLGATTGGTATAQLGTVGVSDLRAVASPIWTATVISTAFTTGAGGPGLSVAATNVSYWSGPTTATTGNGTFTPGQATAAALAPIDATTTAFSHAGGSGSNSAAWNPTLIVTIPIDASVGDYAGTITHSVA